MFRVLWFAARVFAVGVTLNCEKIVKLLHQRHQHRAGLLLAPGGSHGAAAGFTGLLQEGGGRQPGSQCDVLVCVRGRDGRLLVRLQALTVPVGAAAGAHCACCMPCKAVVMRGLHGWCISAWLQKRAHPSCNTFLQLCVF